jgi:hypothetical protein
MNDQIQEIPRHSPVYPLPSDYPDLTEDGRRLARINATRQWLIKGGTIEERASRLIASTWFFDTHYLHPDPEDNFDPGFYDSEPLPTPAYHWTLSRMWVHPRSAVVAPRGGAKTSHIKKDTLLRIVSAPKYSIVYATSTHENSRSVGQSLKDQAYENRRINDDFAPAFDVRRLKPGRGEKMTATEHFHLNNLSSVRCVSAGTRVRGVRPRVFKLDDPEYDETGSTSMDQIRAYMERLLFKLALPMTFRPDCFVHWVGTFVSKRHYLWQAMETVADPTHPGRMAAVDPRFNLWERAHIYAAWNDPETGALVSCWPQMWPATPAEKERLNLPPSTISIQEMREIMGPAAFNAEMQGLPGNAAELLFKRDTDPKGRHSYWFEEVDHLVNESPISSSTLICWHDPDGTLNRVPLREFLQENRTFITVDTAFTETASSDRRVAHLMAITPKNVLFSLDMWSDRRNDNELLKQTFAMAQRWQARYIFVEVVRESLKLYQRFQHVIQTRMTENFKLAYVPGLEPLRPGSTSKTDKISMLDARFDHALVKLPTFKAHTANPAYARFFDQIDSFNPSAPNGGLAKDDEIDTMAMSTYAIRGRLGARFKNQERPISIETEILAGRKHLPGTTVPIISGLSEIPVDLVLAVQEQSTHADKESVI